ncbi:MAG: hypothetical protein HYW91_01750 [Candidatus Sungbacteria bacterium]|nr:hypothetical protein [Candidatus Sungbacteria bacterium]
MSKVYTLFLVPIFIFGLTINASAHSFDKPVHEILGVADPALLPDSPFYFLKNMGRGLRLFFTFDPAKKAELELKFADEKLAEMAKTAETKTEDVLKQALQNYLDAQIRLKARFESLKGKNKNVDKLLEKLAERVKIHEELFAGLQDEIGPEASEKAVREVKNTENKGLELKEEKGGKPKEKSSENPREEILQKPSPKTSAAADTTVTVTSDDFTPQMVKIKKGDTVTWVNNSGNPVRPASAVHPTHELYPEFDSKRAIGAGGSYSFTFDRGGVWKYHNHLKPSMTGTVEVEE